MAGRWHTLRIVVNVALAVAGIVIARSWPGGSALLAVIAGAWTLLARECLIVAEGRERRRAVNAQELFDTYVFELPWNTGLAGPAPAEEDVVRAAVKNRRPAPTDWYADTEDLPRPLDVILSQRSSAVWGRNTHYAYSFVVLSFAVLLLLLGALIAFVTHLSPADYLLRLFLPTLPALLDAVDLSRAHWSTSKDKGRIEAGADQLWARAVNDPATISEADCRSLQDQSYRLRLSGPRVATWLYRWRRSSDEHAMRQAVDQRLTDYRTRACP